MKRVLVMSLVVCSAGFLSVVSMGLLFLLTEGSPASARAEKASRKAPPPAPDTGPPMVAERLPAPTAARGGAPDPTLIQALTLRLAPLQSPPDTPGPGDWLAQHREPGQTFQAYLGENPVHARGKRKVLYVQPIGHFDRAERKVLNLTARFLGTFYCLPVQVMKNIPATVIPGRARRMHPFQGGHQLLTTYILQEVLMPRLPVDAASLIALTAWDLWPGGGWNFVFGMAMLQERVGVWSTHRFGDPVKKRKQHLLRAFKIASHETGHMFSIRHCTAHKCGMAGSNSLPETDRHPLTFCPHCLAKLLWATGCDASARYRSLAALLDEAGLKKQAARYRELLAAL